MTTKKDNFKLRRQKLGSGLEESLGVYQEGFQSSNCEFPKREYNFGSSINQRQEVLKLIISILVVEILVYHLTLQFGTLSSLQTVDETTSGHVVEYDDKSIFGERILIKHRTGAGVEMRADGSVIVSSTNNRIEVTGGGTKL